MRSLFVLAGLVLVACGPVAPGGSDAGGSFEDGGRPDAGSDAGVDAGDGTFRVTVQGGFGAGVYRPGDPVHVWADLAPKSEVLDAWTGDAALLERPGEWHTRFTMPARDVALAASKRTVDGTLAKSTFTGPSGLARTVYSRIPATPRGLVLFMHGTGGSASGILRTEPAAIASAALDHGYGVLATEAAEVVAGDLNGDGKVRWSTTPSTSNQDFGDLDALLAHLVSTGASSATTPVYLLGMSNGGAMSIVLGALESDATLAAAFPHLRFAAVISHCADGTPLAVSRTRTPTAWRMCARDDNPEVSNTQAQSNHATLVSRGIDTDYLEHPPSPLYDARFLRAGADLATSTALAAELRGFTDASGLFTTPSVTILSGVAASPATYPVLSGLAPALQGAVRDQLRVMEAEHELYSDFTAADLAWFDAHP